MSEELVNTIQTYHNIFYGAPIIGIILVIIGISNGSFWWFLFGLIVLTASLGV